MRYLSWFKFSQKVISSLENSTAPTHVFIISFLFLLSIRCFLELGATFLLTTFKVDPVTFFVAWLHEVISFTAGGMLLILLCYVAVRSNIIKIIKVITTFYPLLLIVPLIDNINRLMTGYKPELIYITTKSFPEITKLFFSYYGNFTGTSLGMRIEIAITLFLLLTYFYTKTRKVIFSVFFTFLVYLLIFIFFCMPLVINCILTLFFHPPTYDMSRPEIIAYSLIVLVAGITMLNLVNRKNANAFVKELSWLRITHYALMLLLGAAFCLDNSSNPLAYIPNIDINFVFCFISIIFSALSTTIINNLSDQSIDRVSNHERALVTGAISIDLYKKIGLYSFLCALYFAAVADVRIFFVILFTYANYYIYSMPPLRFKRVPVLSKLVISLNSLFMLMLGSSLTCNNALAFPGVVAVIFLIGLTCCINFIDIKDYAGDKENGIKTLPVVLGLRTAKCVIGVAFILTYLSFYYIVKDVRYIPFMITAGLIQFYLVNKKNYNEQFVFVVNNICFVVLIIYLVAHSFHKVVF